MEDNIAHKQEYLWVIQTLCGLFRKPFSMDLAQKEITPPYDDAILKATVEKYGFSLIKRNLTDKKLRKATFPILVWLNQDTQDHDPSMQYPAFIMQQDDDRVLMVILGGSQPQIISKNDFFKFFTGLAYEVKVQEDGVTDPDSAYSGTRKKFSFSWFVPELLKYKKLWQEVILASFVIQIIGLVMPLFTQVIIDKVVVHRTQSTLIVIMTGMILFTIFSALLSWLRQYLILHTGNRVDGTLGSAVFSHLVKLPQQYFQVRPTGVIAARLHGIETIREFIASAAVALVLDFPFLFIFLGVMCYYSLTLTAIVLVVLLLIASISLFVAPIFQKYLQKQFLLGARNQAFLTEYIAGMETVKSLQLESQLISRYRSYLSAYLQSGFVTRQLANSYNSVATILEQMIGILVIGVGALLVMDSNNFSIGMLIAFQMFSGKLSQPVMKLVGLWQQFQQAKLAVDRLGDVMDIPEEPYALLPTRGDTNGNDVRIEGVSFRYYEKQPFLYENLHLTLYSGKTIVLMGHSGSGKSTLTKLLQAFHQPESGRIMIGDVDIRYLAANELRRYFGIVPQETILFSGTILDNLKMANPDLSFEHIAQACRMAEIHDVIISLPQGYQTEIGERGSGLSGGQKQRIAIARALLKQPKILIFDEATSALDKATERSFIETINRLKGHITILFITHSLSPNLAFDELYMLNKDGAVLVNKPPVDKTHHSGKEK